MELVPEEELEASSRGGSAPPADRRALKVDYSSTAVLCVCILLRRICYVFRIFKIFMFYR